MFVGLLTEDQHSHPIPGMAQRWETSEDGLTWTFFLRPAQWSDGNPCNAHDFEFAFRRILDPANLAVYASFLYAIKNAEAVNNGRMHPNQVGVFALDDLTLEIRLEHPAPYLPQLLKHYTSFPVPKHLVRRYGNDWIKPEHIAVNGAFTLRRWWSNYIVHLERNPHFFDAPNVVFQNLYFYPSSDVNASARKVMSGEAGWATRFASNQYRELRRALPGYPRVAPFLVCNYFAFNVRARRSTTSASAKRFPWPTIAISSPRRSTAPASGRPTRSCRRASPTIRARRAIAGPICRWPIAARQAQSLAGGRRVSGPTIRLRFEVAHRATSDNPRVAVVAQANWRAIAPWVIVDLHPFEAQVHYANLQARNFQVGESAWVADFNDARNFLYLLETRSGQQNNPGYSNPEYDRLVLASDFEPNAGRSRAVDDASRADRAQ